MRKTYQKLKKRMDLPINSDWLSIQTIDMHTGGEPLRVIIDGFPPLVGNSVLEFRKDCRDRFDHLRTALMHEPRGHRDMYGCILLPPDSEDSDFGIIFLHNDGYSTMCGHAIIAISKLAVVMNWIDAKNGNNIIKIDAPCGQITSTVSYQDGNVGDIKFTCVPSFVIGLDLVMAIPHVGEVIYDLAYGGAFYAYVDIDKNNFDFDLLSSSYRELIEMGMFIKNAINDSDKVVKHPFEEDLSFLYGTIFIDNKRQESGSDSRNVCVFANGEVDRCPTGSGISGRMAIHYARNEMEVGDEMAVEGITGSVFVGSIVSEVGFGEYTAVIPSVKGDAFITGKTTFVIDPSDPMSKGFLLGV